MADFSIEHQLVPYSYVAGWCAAFFELGMPVACALTLALYKLAEDIDTHDKDAALVGFFCVYAFIRYVDLHLTADEGAFKTMAVDGLSAMQSPFHLLMVHMDQNHLNSLDAHQIYWVIVLAHKVMREDFWRDLCQITLFDRPEYCEAVWQFLKKTVLMTVTLMLTFVVLLRTASLYLLITLNPMILVMNKSIFFVTVQSSGSIKTILLIVCTQ
jgi:hypothetical protein